MRCAETGQVPVTVLATIDSVLRDSASAGIVLSGSSTVALSYEVDDGLLQRTVADATGVLEKVTPAGEHTCLSCAVGEDVVPALLRLADPERWSSIVLALPVGAEFAPLIHGVGSAVYGVAFASRLRLASTVCVVDPASLETDLFGDDLLAERGLALGDHDRRAVGEAAARQLEHADIIVTSEPAGPRPSRLIEHLRGRDTARRDVLHSLDAQWLFADHHDADRAARRIDPRYAAPRAATDDGVWALDLSSPRPLHPRRLMERLADLGQGQFRCRGRFWLPTRPATVCAWDGAGGQLSIGDAGRWPGAHRSTRLVATGVDDSPVRVAEAFIAVLVTEREMAAGLGRWSGVADGLDQWFGVAPAPEGVTPLDLRARRRRA